MYYITKLKPNIAELLKRRYSVLQISKTLNISYKYLFKIIKDINTTLAIEMIFGVV